MDEGFAVTGQPISDDERVMRRVPPGATWFEPPARLSSGNFALRPGELGLSVYREQLISQNTLLELPGTIPGSMVVSASVGEIRRLCNGAGLPLHLDVIAVDDDDNPGHAEIRAPGDKRFSRSISVALRDLFQKSLQIRDE